MKTALFEVAPSEGSRAVAPVRKSPVRKKPAPPEAPPQTEVRTGRMFVTRDSIALLCGTVPPGTAVELVSRIVAGRGNFRTVSGVQVCHLEVDRLEERS